MSSDSEKSATDAQSEEKSTPAEKPAPKPVEKKPEEKVEDKFKKGSTTGKKNPNFLAALAKFQ